GERMFRTPTYHAFRLHAAHLGATALPVEVSAADSVPNGSPAVTGTASRSDTGLTVTLINRHLSAAADVCVDLGLEASRARAELLTADSPRSTNCADMPDRVSPRSLSV